MLGSFSNVASGAAVKGTQVFGPYGKTRYAKGTINTAKGFTGQYNDGLTGLDYYNARSYDPVAGVFLSADSAQGNGQGMNPYGYVGGNPETWSDPSGRVIAGPGGQRCYPGVGCTGGSSETGSSNGGGSNGGAAGNNADGAAETLQAAPRLPSPPPDPFNGTARQVAYRLAQWTEFYRAVLGDQTRRNYAEGAWYITDSAGNFLMGPTLMSSLPAQSLGKAGENHSEFLLLLAWEVSGSVDKALSTLNDFLHAGIQAELHMVVFTQWPACQGWCTPFFSVFMNDLDAKLQPMLNVEPVPLFLVPTRVMSISVFSATSPPNSTTPAPVSSPSNLTQNYYQPAYAMTILDFW